MLPLDDTTIRFKLNQQPRTYREEAGVNARIVLARPARQPIRDRVLLRTGELLVEAGTRLKRHVAPQPTDCSPLFEARTGIRVR